MSTPGGPETMDADWLRGVLGPHRVGHGNLRAERIGEGYGLGGIAARLHLPRPAGGPGTLVAKWCPAAKGRSEAAFYREIAPALDLDLPDLHGAWFDAPADRALLLMEDVFPARQGDAIEGLSPADADALVDAAASFHAAFWGDAAVPALDGLRRWESAAGDAPARTAAALPAFLAAHGDALSPAAREAIGDLPRRLEGALAALREAPPTLVHDDLHGDNVLFRPDGTPVILDWPDAALGPAAVDVAHLLVEALTVEGRRAREEALLARWCAAAASRGVRGYGPARLREDVDRAGVVFLGAIVRTVAKGPPSPPPDPRLAPLVANLVRNGTAVLEDLVARRPPGLP
jgi:aminoglycoside phosphotransferase (APT) family kinase protein